MNVTVRGKNLPLTEAIKSYVYEKFGRLARYWPEIERVEVTCSVEPTRGVETRHHVEASAGVGGILLHAEERAGDLYAAIDGLVETLERQIRRKKGQLSRRPDAAVPLEPVRPEPEPPVVLLRAGDLPVEKGGLGLGPSGTLPNLLNWPVVGPQGKPIGTVTGLYVHPDQQEIAALVVAAGRKEFTVPLAEVVVESDQERVALRRNLSQLPRVPAEVRGVETPLREFLESYDVPESVIERLEAYGVRTMSDLRLRVEDGRLESLLGDAHRDHLRDIEHLLAEQQ